MKKMEVKKMKTDPKATKTMTKTMTKMTEIIEMTKKLKTTKTSMMLLSAFAMNVAWCWKKKMPSPDF